MAHFSGRIEFHSVALQQQKHIFLASPASLDALKTFAIYLVQHISTAGTLQVAYSEIDVLVQPPSDGEMSSLDTVLHARLRETDSRKTQVLRVPAPRIDLFEYTAKQGYRLKADPGKALAEAFGAVKGLTCEFEDGWIVGQSGS